MWSKRLAIYEREEAELRSKLKQNNEESDTKRNELEREVKGNLEQWKDALFGGTLPQVDFGGDIQAFVAVRYVQQFWLLSIMMQLSLFSIYLKF